MPSIKTQRSCFQVSEIHTLISHHHYCCFLNQAALFVLVYVIKSLFWENCAVVLMTVVSRCVLEQEEVCSRDCPVHNKKSFEGGTCLSSYKSSIGEYSSLAVRPGAVLIIRCGLACRWRAVRWGALIKILYKVAVTINGSRSRVNEMRRGMRKKHCDFSTDKIYLEPYQNMTSFLQVSCTFTEGGPFSSSVLCSSVWQCTQQSRGDYFRELDVIT